MYIERSPVDFAFRRFITFKLVFHDERAKKKKQVFNWLVTLKFDVTHVI
jgi:hypothetical protein